MSPERLISHGNSRLHSALLNQNSLLSLFAYGIKKKDREKTLFYRKTWMNTKKKKQRRKRKE